MRVFFYEIFLVWYRFIISFPCNINFMFVSWFILTWFFELVKSITVWIGVIISIIVLIFIHLCPAPVPLWSSGTVEPYLCPYITYGHWWLCVQMGFWHSAFLFCKNSDWCWRCWGRSVRALHSAGNDFSGGQITFVAVSWLKGRCVCPSDHFVQFTILQICRGEDWCLYCHTIQ